MSAQVSEKGAGEQRVASVRMIGASLAAAQALFAD